jgi:hypothetical protein
MDSLGLWQSIKLGRNDRGTLIGKTGSGKTTLARFLVEDFQKPYSITWDPKASDNVSKWNQKKVTSLTELYESEEKRIIYTPSPFLAEDYGNQEEFFGWIYERKFTRIYIDEATCISYTGNKPPRFLTAVLNRGRERGISSLVATQRPAGVPINILSEAEHFYIFKVLHPYDKKRIEELCGIQVEDQEDLDDFQFYYFNVSRGLFPRKLTINGELVL